MEQQEYLQQQNWTDPGKSANPNKGELDLVELKDFATLQGHEHHSLTEKKLTQQIVQENINKGEGNVSKFNEVEEHKCNTDSNPHLSEGSDLPNMAVFTQVIMPAQQQQQPQQENMMNAGVPNYLGHTYRDMRLDENLNMTSAQQFLFVLLNFTMAIILIISVNCSIRIPCGSEMKQWLLAFSIILALGSLIAVMGLDIARKPRKIRKIHAFSKLGQYLLSVAWLVHGNFVVFLDNDTCPREVPWISTTMMVTLFFGWIQLILFVVFVIGLLVWALAKCCGREISFTPKTLWQDQQQFFDRDPQREVNDTNRQILETLEELVFQEYQREVKADMTYGFQKGDPSYWQDHSDASDCDTMAAPECAICMERMKSKDLVSPLPCHVQHLFHIGCIRPWLLQNRSCPLCKREFQPGDLTDAAGAFMINQKIAPAEAARNHPQPAQSILMRRQSYLSSYSRISTVGSDQGPAVDDLRFSDGLIPNITTRGFRPLEPRIQ